MFYSRAKEKKQLKDVLQGSSICLYGKRRVGKTSLIKAALEGSKYIYYECVKDTLSANLSLFIIELRRNGIDLPSYAHFSSFIEVFDFLSDKEEVRAVVLDEYPYLKEFENENKVDSLFQSIIDHHRGHLGILLCGSSIASMTKLLVEGNPLFGRFNATISLDEFSYLEASLFYPNKSVYEKVAFHAVCGGSPFVNKSINPSLSLKENIKATFLKEGSEVYNYADSVLLTGVDNAPHAKRVLSALSNSKKRNNELVATLDENKTGIIARSLASLLSGNVIRLVYPINKKDDKKKAFYEIADNALRFYYTFVYPNKSQLVVLGEEAFYEAYIAPSIVTFVAHRFEELVRGYFSLLARLGRLSGVRDIGVYYFDDKANHKNGEFDVALQFGSAANRTYAIYEVKYLERKMKLPLLEAEAEKIKAIKELPVEEIGFVSVNGFEEKPEGYRYIEGNELYELPID